jgi:hypothetical protein
VESAPQIRWIAIAWYGDSDCGEWPAVGYELRNRDDQDPPEYFVRDLDLPRGEDRAVLVDRSRARWRPSAFRSVSEQCTDTLIPPR